MKKLIATTCVVAWSFAGAFGYLALSAPQDDSPQIIIDMVLAMAGLAVGLTTWVSLSRADAPDDAGSLPYPGTSRDFALTSFASGKNLRHA